MAAIRSQAQSLCQTPGKISVQLSDVRHNLFASDLPVLQARERAWITLRKSFPKSFKSNRANVLYGLETMAINFNETRIDLIDRVTFVSFGLWERGLSTMPRDETKNMLTNERWQLLLALAAFSLAIKYEDHRYQTDMALLVNCGMHSFPSPIGLCISPEGTPPTEAEISHLEKNLWSVLSGALSPGYPSDFLVLFHGALKADFNCEVSEEEEEKWEADTDDIMKGYRIDATRVMIHASIRDEHFYQFPPSLLAAAALYASVLTPRWPPELETASGYDEKRVRTVALLLDTCSQAFVKGTDNAKYLPRLRRELVKRGVKNGEYGRRKRTPTVPPTPIREFLDRRPLKNEPDIPASSSTPASHNPLVYKSFTSLGSTKREREEEEPRLKTKDCKDEEEQVQTPPAMRPFRPFATPMSKTVGCSATPSQRPRPLPQKGETPSWMKPSRQTFQPTIGRFLEVTRASQEKRKLDVEGRQEEPDRSWSPPEI